MFEMTPVLFIAQETQALPPVPGEAPSTPVNPGGANTTAASGAGGTPPSPFGSEIITLFIVLMVAMLIFSYMGQRRDRKKREALIGAIKKHDRVRTIGGVIGSVVEIKPDTVVLKVDESSNTRITFARSAIQEVLITSEESPTAKAE